MFQTASCAPRAWMWLSVLGFSLTPGPGVPASVPIETHRAVDAVIESVKPALVRLRVVSTRYVDGRELKYQSVGSGVIITPAGHIVTNYHVAGHAVRIFCTLSDREEIEAELVGTDPLTDIIIEVGGKPILVRHDEELPIFTALITGLPVGEPVAFTLLRDNRERTLTLTPLEREEVWPRQREFRAWGVTARNLSSLLARELKRPSTDGVLVTSIRPGGPTGEAKPRIEPQDVIVEINEQPVRSIEDLQILTATQTGVLVEEVRSGSWAELGMLYAGDLILEVDGQPVTGVDSMRSIMEQVALASPSHVVLKILRGIHNRYLVLEPKWNL